MGPQSDPREASRSQKDENDIGQRLSCQHWGGVSKSCRGYGRRCVWPSAGELSSKVQNSAWNRLRGAKTDARIVVATHRSI
jgi:hypothetical protein